MPRYTAPNHKDCWIDCAGGGYAIFVPPHGPCEKGCDDPGAALVKVLGQDINIHFACRIQLIGRSKFVKFCTAISGLNLGSGDRHLLWVALGRVAEFKTTKSGRSLRLIIEHSDATIASLINDIVRATYN